MPRNSPPEPARGTADWEITASGAQARTFVIAAREDKQIAAGVRSLWPSVSAV
jgi:hypothetical protein